MDDSGYTAFEEPIKLMESSKIKSEDIKVEVTSGGNATSNDKSQRVKVQNPYLDLSTLGDDIVKQLLNLENPKSEIEINQKVITDLEKCIHSEFFEDRPTKTPLRYLKVCL